MNLHDIKDDKKEPYFICIGHPEHPYDSIAPRIGTILDRNGYKVLGTMKNPINAINISNYTNLFKSFKRCGRYQLIAIDAVLTPHNYNYKIKNEPCRPGAGVKKKLPSVGEYTIMVNSFYNEPHLKLWQRRLKIYFPFRPKLASIEIQAKSLFNEIKNVWEGYR